jgi:hypothetical protein
MSNLQSLVKQPYKENGQKTKPAGPINKIGAVDQGFELPGVQPGPEMSGPGGSQAELLGDARMQTVQRQKMVAQIGRVGGNRHLQRAIRTSGQNGNKTNHRGQGSQHPSSPLRTGVIQREVNPLRVESVDKVLAKVKRVTESTGEGKKPAEANLARLMQLIKPGVGFNPGATADEADNMFVYTCRGGWIDMGHFFISAAAAYGIGYQQKRVEIRAGGTPYGVNELLTKATNKLTPLLEILLKTVPDGVQGKTVLSDVQKLLKSGEPRDLALVLGYWMEFVQQVAKVISDPGRKLPDALKEKLQPALDEYGKALQSIAPKNIQETIEGSARSAFTMEDLPSDCYGSDLGQQVWLRTDGAKIDSSPIYSLVQDFFSKVQPVFSEPDSKIRCEMMNETTPGSCRDGKVQAGQGEPTRYGSTKARLLNSAKPLCGDTSVLPCSSGTGAGAPLPATVVDVSGKGVTVAVPGNIPVHEPKARGEFGGGVSIPGRPERLQQKSPLVLGGPSFLQITPRGNVLAYSTVKGVEGLGDLSSSAYLSLGSGRFNVQAKGALQFDVNGKVEIDFEALFKGLAGPELDQLKEIFKSEAFTDLAQKLLRGDVGIKEFMSEVKALVKRGFPQGLKGVLSTVLARLENMEALALSTSLDARGVVRVGDIPLSGFLLHKSGGMSPLLGMEAGLVFSELAKEHVLVGAKGWLYGQDLLQAQLSAGVDPLKGVGIADLHVESKYFGNKLTLDAKYQVNLEGNQQFLVLFGGEHNWFGSKGKGAK